jgi:hypothetical protein
VPFGPTYADRHIGWTVLGSPVTAIETVYLALCSSIGSVGLSVAEVPSGTAYARQRIIFGAPTNRRTINVNSFAYPASSTPWGDIPHLALYDDVTGGTLIAFGTLVATKTIATSVIVACAIGSVTYRMN